MWCQVWWRTSQWLKEVQLQPAAKTDVKVASGHNREETMIMTYSSQSYSRGRLWAEKYCNCTKGPHLHIKQAFLIRFWWFLAHWIPFLHSYKPAEATNIVNWIQMTLTSTPGTPIISMFHWKCSRRRPRVILSYLQHWPIANHFRGYDSPFLQQSKESEECSKH